MKRIVGLLTAFLLLCGLFAFPASAAEVTISSVYPADSKTESYSVGDNVVITGSCSAGKDVVLRIYNEKQALIYTDVIEAPYNTTGTFQFTNFNIPATNSSDKLNYTVVVSETPDGAETTNIATANMVINGKNKSTNSGYGGSSGGGTSNNAPSMVVPWVPKSTGVTTDNQEESKEEITADKDPIGDEKRNKELWDYVNDVETETEAEKAIGDITKATEQGAMKGETARNNVAVAGETLTANLGAKTVKTGSGNRLSLNENSVAENDLSKLDRVMETVEKAIKDNKIALNRQMKKELVLNATFNKNSKATIAISKKLVEKLINAKVDLLTIKDSDFKITYTIQDLLNMFGNEDEVTFEVDKSGLTNTTKKISVNFDTDRTQSVKISFPGLDGDAKYMAIVDENGNPVGGRYNPATGALEAKIAESGVYEVVYNEKDFEDIKNLSEEMQNSIKILASKGIIEGTSTTEFSPENSISRAEIAALLLRVLAEIDPNADGGFTDVKKTDWYYGTAGSAKNYGMIVGFEDNTFRGNDVIAKEQILTVASRILKKEMRYIAPENPSEWLTFTDSASISNWARDDIALATMANIVTRTADNTIHAGEEMTRGDAALIIMRLFYKIW